MSARACPVCGEKRARRLFRQTFAAFSEGGLLTGYDLVVCAQCGAAYADGLPPRETFDAYYARMSKYEQSHRDGNLSPTDRERFVQIADLLAPALHPSDRILDVGCATGGLLAELQRRGFHDLLGLDPSAACAAVAKRLYGIKVRNLSLADLAAREERFDVAALTGVFEHLPELDEAIAALAAILKPGGRVYLETPDATAYRRWFGAPYQFLSIEHVNFFSPASLTDLMMRRGFECVFARREIRRLGPQSVEPAVSALFTFTGKSTPAPRDMETEPALIEYLDSSQLLEKSIREKISALVETRVPLAVWGAGTHTARLLEVTQLGSARILNFIDSNPRYRGKTLRGIPIVAPGDFQSPEATILISSQVAESEIKDQIRNSLGWNNPIVCFYDASPKYL